MKIMDDKSIRSALVTTPQPAAGWDEARVSLLDFVSSQRQYLIDPELRDEICNRLIALRREAPAPAEGKNHA